MTSVALMAVLIVVAAACGGDSGSGTTTTAAAGGGSTTTAGGGTSGAGEKIGMVYDTTGRGDKSFNDSAAEGLDKAKTDFGVQIKDLTPSSGGENREELLRLLTTDGYNPNFAVGFLFADSVKAVATDNPDVNYAIIDEVVDLPNVSSLTFAEEQGSYLMGAAAALKSTTDNIGFIGGVNTPLIQKFQAGYEAGAKKINPDITIQVKYLTEPPDFTGFSDPAKGKEAASAMYSNGADVVYQAAGGSGLGVFQAAKEYSDSSGTQVWAIGVDSDQYNSVGDPSLQPFILTSMIKHVNVAVYDTIKAWVDGTLKGGHTTFDLESGGIDYATSGGFIDDIKSQLDDLKQQIIDGTITVPTTPS
jgi:basic membrane protein A